MNRISGIVGMHYDEGRNATSHTTNLIHPTNHKNPGSDKC